MNVALDNDSLAPNPPSDDTLKMQRSLLVNRVSPFSNELKDMANQISPISHKADDDQSDGVNAVKRLQTQRHRLAQQRVRLEERLYNSRTLLSSAISTSTTSAGSLRLAVTNRIYPYYHYSGQMDPATRLPDGIGIISYLNGQVYRGEIVQGKRQGRGENRWAQQVYVGSWYQDQRQGRGTHRWDSGKSVTGQWYEGHLHGRIFCEWPGGRSYDGDCAKGKKHGRGIQTWPNGKVYSGHYEKGTEQGYATLTSSRGVIFRGQFQAGSRHGYGIQVWKHKTYDGEWSNNVMHGRGKLVYKNKDACYTGEFRYGKFHGSGCYSGGRHKKYVGQWKNGLYRGTGKEYLSDGRVYIGSFSAGRRHGYGRMLYPDGSLFTGGWSRGKRWGRGIQLASDGSVVHCGPWQEDAPVHEEPANVRDDSDAMTASRSSLSTNEEDEKLIPEREYNETLAFSPSLSNGKGKLTLFFEI
jgi:hypothetical protein